MDSEVKTASRTDEEETPSVLRYIQEKLRPLILRNWRGSRANVVAEVMEEGLTDKELVLYLAGFKRGYWSGAVDTASIKPGDLRPGPRPLRRKTSKVH
jgi:hypothetical protein